MVELRLVEPIVEQPGNEADVYTPYAAGRYSLATPIYRLAANAAERPDGTVAFNKTAISYSQRDVASRLLEGAVEAHPFSYVMTYDQERDGLTTGGDLLREVTSRWLESDDIKGSGPAAEHARAEHRETLMLEDIAREAYVSGAVPDIKLLTVWVAPEIKEKKTVQLRLFSFNYVSSSGVGRVEVAAEGLVVDDAETVDVERIIRRSGAIVPRQPDSVELAYTAIPVSKGKYESIFDVAEEYRELDWRQTEHVAEPILAAELEFTRELAISIYRQELTDSIAGFVNEMAGNEALDTDTREYLKALADSKAELNETVVEFLTGRHSVYAISALGLVLGNPAIIEALTESDSARSAYAENLNMATGHSVNSTISSRSFMEFVDSSRANECIGLCGRRMQPRDQLIFDEPTPEPEPQPHISIKKRDKAVAPIGRSAVRPQIIRNRPESHIDYAGDLFKAKVCSSHGQTLYSGRCLACYQETALASSDTSQSFSSTKSTGSPVRQTTISHGEHLATVAHLPTSSTAASSIDIRSAA